MPDEFTAFPLRKDYPLRGRGERHNFPRLTRERVLTPSRSERPSTVDDRPTISTMPRRTMPANLLDEPELGAGRRSSTTGPSTSGRSTRPRTRPCAWSWSWTASGSSRPRPHIGYLHSGFEKLGEHLNFNQYVTIADRKNYISPPMNEVAWHHAVEKLLDIELTPRCQYIRVIIGELSRISDHLLCTGAAALDLGAFTAFLYAFNLRELIYDVYEEMSGYRFHPGYTRVGGVLYDFNDKVHRPDPARCSTSSRRSSATWRSCSSATGSSSTGCGASAS